MKIETADGIKEVTQFVCGDKIYPAESKEAVETEKYKKAWVPNHSDKYYCVQCGGNVGAYLGAGNGEIMFGNTFQTEEQAQRRTKYIGALNRVLNVIEENGQLCEYGHNGASIFYHDKMHIRQCNKYYIGDIIVKDEDFAKWIIENYADDLKILAGVTE